MALDDSYLDAIKGFEGYSPQASWDYKQYSSGYGTKAQPGDENIPPDQRQAVYNQRFHDEVGNAEKSVDSFAPNLPSGVRAALTSLTYNAGPGWQNQGLGDAIKSGDYGKAQNLFLQYNHAGGQVNQALVSRRQQEAAWFGGNAPSPSSQPAQPQQAAQPQQTAGLPPPQQQQPIFPQQMAQAPTQAGGSLFSQMQPQIQAPQIYYAPRRQYNPLPLSQAPIFSQG